MPFSYVASLVHLEHLLMAAPLASRSSSGCPSGPPFPSSQMLFLLSPCSCCLSGHPYPHTTPGSKHACRQRPHLQPNSALTPRISPQIACRHLKLNIRKWKLSPRFFTCLPLLQSTLSCSSRTFRRRGKLLGLPTISQPTPAADPSFLPQPALC